MGGGGGGEIPKGGRAERSRSLGIWPRGGGKRSLGIWPWGRLRSRGGAKSLGHLLLRYASPTKIPVYRPGIIPFKLTTCTTCPETLGHEPVDTSRHH